MLGIINQLNGLPDVRMDDLGIIHA